MHGTLENALEILQCHSGLAQGGSRPMVYAIALPQKAISRSNV